MEKKRNGQLIVIGILAFAILFMSIGFANYTKDLNISGEVKVKPASWNIHWDTESYQKDASSVDFTQADFTNATTFSFKATLQKPGDVAKFTIKAANDGTFNAKLTGITLSDISTYSNYLTYEVKYGNTAYTASASNLNTLLSAGDDETVTVTVTYITPADSANLPSSEVTVNLSAAFAYESVA